jgi:hypothetical protein
MEGVRNVPAPEQGAIRPSDVLCFSCLAVVAEHAPVVPSWSGWTATICGDSPQPVLKALDEVLHRGKDGGRNRGRSIIRRNSGRFEK